MTAPLTVSAADNAALARKAYDLWNRRDFDGGAALCAPDVEVVNIATGQTFPGPEGVRRYQQSWATAFPDARVEVTHVIAAEDGAVVEFTGRGTHTGPLAGPQGEIPATGRPVEIRFCDVYEIRGGKIARQRTYFDLATLMRQLGLMS